MDSDERTYPWGCQKFDAANTYAPHFHQPAKLKHIDRNSQIELNWSKVKKPVKTATVVEEMKETLDKINDLLTNLTSTATSRSQPKLQQQPKLVNDKKNVPSVRDSTLNSNLESISRDISAITLQLKENSEARDASQMVKQEPSTESDSGVGLSDSIRSRTCSSNTINSNVPSLKSSHNNNSNDTSTSNPVDRSECSENATNRKRSISEATSCFYRGSELSQMVSLHKSSFGSIAALCGFGELTKFRPRGTSSGSKKAYYYDVLAGSPSQKETKPRSHTQHNNGYYTEYPPQNGGSTFKGIFEHDISGLYDDSARGLISF